MMNDNEFLELTFSEVCEIAMHYLAERNDLEKQCARLLAQNERLCKENALLRNEQATALRASVEPRMERN